MEIGARVRHIAVPDSQGTVVAPDEIVPDDDGTACFVVWDEDPTNRDPQWVKNLERMI